MPSKLLEKSYDSEFSDFLTDYFPDDRPITPEKKIIEELDNIEDKASSLFNNTYEKSLANAVKTLQTAIADKDQEKIRKFKWGLNIELGKNLWGEWLLGFFTGNKRGESEINSVAKSNFAAEVDTLQFSQPEPESAIIRNVPAEKAIKARINTLSRDVSDSEWKEVRNIILQSIKPQSETEPPISRRELLKRINQKLGNRRNRFKNRAERIARTELTFAYNAGRLDSYVRSGLVEGVRYQTIFDERRCDICASRQGIIVALDDIEGLAQLQIPAHPMCRCVWSPVLKTDFKRESSKKFRQLKNRKTANHKPWLAGGIIAALLIPEELALAGFLAVGLQKLIKKAGSTKLAQLTIASKFNKIGSPDKAVSPKQPITLDPASAQLKPTKEANPIAIAPGVNLQTAGQQELRSLIPSLTEKQAFDLIAYRRKTRIESLNQLSSILAPNQLRKLRAIARQNSLFNLLSPETNTSPSALWVKTGGIIPKDKARKIYKLIRAKQFNSLEELEKALSKEKINVPQLKSFANTVFQKNWGL